MAAIPYLASPGTIKTALERIRSAATPDRVTQDFIADKLALKGGAGKAVLAYLKKLGFVGSDGSPTELYKRFRNPSLGPYAVGEGIKLGYKALAQVNENFHSLNDTDLAALVVQVTGAAPGDSVTKQAVGTLKAIKSLAKFDAPASGTESGTSAELTTDTTQRRPSPRGSGGLNLSYTINLNLPATADQAVFNAIFKSLKEHLLSDDDE
jgi:hypothetical protein